MRQTIFFLLIFFSFASQAQMNFRLGVSTGESKLSDVNPDNKQSYFFSGSNFNADLIFYMGRLGVGARYSKMDTIKDYQINSAHQRSSSYETLSPSSAKMINSGLSGLVTYRFYESEFQTDVQLDKVKMMKVPSKSFGELVLTAGKSNQFRMITQDETGIEANYMASNVDNYSASLMAGFQVTVLQVGLEAGYREMHIHDAHSNTFVANREEAYKIAYPFLGASVGFGF